MPSDVQVFVKFAEPCVFAGEEVRCTITFRNVADLREKVTRSRGWRTQGVLPVQRFPEEADRVRWTSSNSRLRPVHVDGGTANVSRHKATMSLSTPADFQPSLPPSRSDTPPGQRQIGQRHLRSQSIVSETTSDLPTTETRIRRTQRQGISVLKGHARSPTLPSSSVGVSTLKGMTRKVSLLLYVSTDT